MEVRACASMMDVTLSELSRKNSETFFMIADIAGPSTFLVYRNWCWAVDKKKKK